MLGFCYTPNAMNVLVLCTHGKNRSRYLAEYLSKKGYQTDFAGVRMLDATALREKIRWADVVITVHDIVREGLHDIDFEGVRHIALDVEDRPEHADAGGKQLDGEEWSAFQREHVYPKLEEQIERHLPF